MDSFHNRRLPCCVHLRKCSQLQQHTVPISIEYTFFQNDKRKIIRARNDINTWLWTSTACFFRGLVAATALRRLNHGLSRIALGTIQTQRQSLPPNATIAVMDYSTNRCRESVVNLVHITVIIISMISLYPFSVPTTL